MAQMPVSCTVDSVGTAALQANRQDFVSFYLLLTMNSVTQISYKNKILGK